MSAKLSHRIRSARASDENLILGTFIHSTRRMRPWSSTEPNWFCSAQRALAQALFSHEVSTVLVACNPDDDDHCYGWIAGSPERRVLHYCYVKDPMREAGVGTSLMRSMFGEVGPNADPVKYTIRTVASQHYVERWNLTYQPHALVEALK